MLSGERRLCIGSRTLDGLSRREAVYQTVCGCVEENGDSVSDGSKRLEKNGDCVSEGH
jgi:hypothetical protein